MPTENRSSNTEMVSVSREAIEQAAELLQEYNKCSIARDLRAILAQPAEQNQDKPVMRLECEKLWGGDGEYAVDFVKPGWLQECRKKGGTFLLYTHADPAEVERLRAELDEWKKRCQYNADTAHDIGRERDSLRAQLAEAQALLRDLDDAWNSHDGREWFGKLMQKVESLLASTEPSAPVERDDETLIDALRTCEKWFIKHSPTAPLIGGFGDAEHPMLTCIRAALERKPQVKS